MSDQLTATDCLLISNNPLKTLTRHLIQLISLYYKRTIIALSYHQFSNSEMID